MITDLYMPWCYARCCIERNRIDNQPFYPTGSVWDIESCVNFLLQICLVRGLGNIYWIRAFVYVLHEVIADPSHSITAFEGILKGCYDMSEWISFFNNRRSCPCPTLSTHRHSPTSACSTVPHLHLHFLASGRFPLHQERNLTWFLNN